MVSTIQTRKHLNDQALLHHLKTSKENTVMILALLLACNTEKLPSEEIETTEAMDTSTEEEAVVESCSVSEVFERNGCMGCHDSNAELNGGGINLTAETLEESLIGVPSISPGCTEDVLVNVENPEASIILHNLSNDWDNTTLSSECAPIPMPLGGYYHHTVGRC